VGIKLSADWMMIMDNEKLKRSKMCCDDIYKGRIKACRQKLWGNIHLTGSWDYIRV
jgi:hypothetical protein